MSKNLVILVETALFAALAMALSFIPDFASWFTPSFGAIPLVLFSLRRGTKYGLLAGLLWGLLHFVLAKVYYLSLSQVFIEYVLAFTSMGLAGVMSPYLKKALKKDEIGRSLAYGSLGTAFAVGLRYFWHYVAGFIFWGSYAPKGMSPFWYSFTVNGSAGILTFFAVLLVLLVLMPKQKQFFLAD